MLIDPKSALFLNLRRKAAQFTQRFIDAGLYDLEREGPDIAAIEALIAAQKTPDAHLSPAESGLLWHFEQIPVAAGSAFQALGEPEIARAWYRAGQYGWQEGAHWREGDISELHWAYRDGPAIHQIDTAICAALSGNPSRARQLFGWAEHNLAKTDQEMEFEEKNCNYEGIWQDLGYQLFSLAWIGEQWDEVQRLAEVGRRMIEKTRQTWGPRFFGGRQHLIEIAANLSAYFLNPNENTRQAAVDLLRVEKIPDREPHARSGELRYLFALAQRYPQLCPYPESDFNSHLWRPSHRDSLPTRSEFQAALNEVLRQAQKKKKEGVVVSSIDLHLRVGGYPGKEHGMDLCCQVMRRAMLQRDRITEQTLPPSPPLLEVVYSLPRPGLDLAYPVDHRN